MMPFNSAKAKKGPKLCVDDVTGNNRLIDHLHGYGLADIALAAV